MKRMCLMTLLLVVTIGLVSAAGETETAAAENPSITVWAVNAAELPLDVSKIEAWNVIERKTGLEMDWIYESSLSNVKDEKFNLMMASGEIADVVAYYEGQGGHTMINRYGTEGAFLPLEELIARHAPNLKKAVLDDPLVREAVTAPDGRIYFIPMLSALNAERGWFIRYDWLEKLGLEVPATTDDLYRVLTAFRDRDPNGNGQKDEIPLVVRTRGDDWTYNIGALAYAFDADTDWVLRGNRVAYGPAEPQFAEYLAYVQKLYTERLLDQEFLTRKGNPRDELLGKNVAGTLHDWFASTATLNDTLGPKIPGFNLRHFAPPVGTVPKPFTRIQMSKVRVDGGWSISSMNEYPVETIRMMDFVYSPEGRLLTNFGVEGTHYVMKDGKPVYTELITKNPDGLGMHEALVTAGAQWKIGMVQSIEYEAQFANAIATAARLDYMENYIADKFPTLSFTEAETEVLKDKYSQLRSYVLEMSARTIVGELKAADWTARVSEMKKMGLDEITAIYQAAFDRKN